jgi:hypothetical protein
LVCREWHANGLQFLYQHISLTNFEQIKALHRTLDSLTRKNRAQRLSWIQGLELLSGPTPEHQIRDYWLLGGDLILEIPPGNLKFFAIESFYTKAPSLNSKVLKRLRESVEVLQLRCDHWSRNFEWKFLEKLLSTVDPQIEGWAIFPHLRHFRYAGDSSTLALLRDSIQSLQSVATSWPPYDLPAQKSLNLLSMAKTLTNVFITTSEPALLFCRDFEALLTTLASLKHLTVSTSTHHRREEPATFAQGIVHTALEDVTILLEYMFNYKVIHNLDPLFTKIKSRELPNLAKIVIGGPYIQGCLDSGLVFGPPYRKKWSQAIKVCERRRIKLVTPDNDLIHLWEERHGIKKEGHTGDAGHENERSNPTSIHEEDADIENDEESEDDSINTSDDSRWYRLDEDNGATPRTSSNPSSIWGDSEDGPYRYMAQPDIELVDSESESTEDEL